MADFEGLIRQALARQNDADPAIREKVYQSSRKALARMIASAGVQPPDVITRQQMALENSIRRIEADYQSRHTPSRDAFERRLPASPASRGQLPDEYRQGGPPAAGRRRPPDFGPGPRPSESGYRDPRLEPPSGRRDPEIVGDYEEDTGYGDYDNAARRMTERPGSTIFRRIIAVLALLAILGVIGWLCYVLVVSVLGNRPASSIISQSPPPAVSTPGGADQDADAQTGYITLLSPSDTSALETAGRGKAEIITQSNLEMIRLTSLRSASDRGQPAPPILVTIQEGVLSQIAGKRVTVEILAKSGASGPATFAVGCEFAGEDLCGRKRFRLGIQPEAIVFTINVRGDLANADPAQLMISTDIASSASLNGEGDPIDILYARLRLPE